MSARLEPAIPPYAPEAQAVFDRLPQSWLPPFQLFTMLARDPNLLLRFTRGAPIYFDGSHITIRQREILLTRVTANCRCEYEWGMRIHYFAAEAGLTEAQVFATVHGTADDPYWTREERLLIRLADALHDSCDINDVLWAGLQAAFSGEAILELLLLAGYYRTVAYIANGLRLPLEPGIGRAFPKPNGAAAPGDETETNRRLVQSIFAELAAGDSRPFGEAMAEDFRWVVMGQTTWSRAYEGRQAVLTNLLAPLRARLQGGRTHTIAHRFIADGDSVAVLARGNNTTLAGQRYENDYCFIIRLGGGQMHELIEYADTELMTAALGDPGAIPVTA